jgi:sugar phosphate isomerase/epimerase
MHSMTTDYVKDSGCPEPDLRRIAEAGFSHVHWCHQWCTDFVYQDAELDQIERWLADYGLRVLNIHGSMGVEKRWDSCREYERLAGVELVRNRVEMARRLGANVVIMHVAGPREEHDAEPHWDRIRRSVDALAPFCRDRGVRLAIENGDAALIARLLDAFSPDLLGLCYDSGHGNLDPAAPEWLPALRDRLIAVHLHDNDGEGDRHWLPFSGTIDWAWLTDEIAQSAYDGPPNLECTMRNDRFEEEDLYLGNALEAANTIAEMVTRRIMEIGG